MSNQWGHGFYTGHAKGQGLGRLIGAGEQEQVAIDLLFQLQAVLHGGLSFANLSEASDLAARQHAIHTFRAALRLMDSLDSCGGILLVSVEEAERDTQ